MQNWVAIGLKPEEELESANKGPEIIVPLDLLERVECEAAKNLESWQWVDKKKQTSGVFVVRAFIRLEIF